MPEPQPHVTLVAAVSLDGRLSTREREPVDFTSRADREHLFRQRDRVDALLVGSATIRAEDPPQLTKREDRLARRASAGLRPQPARVVVSRSLDLPWAGRALKPHPDSPVIVLAPRASPAEGQQAALAAGHEVALFGEEDLDLPAALAWLKAERGIERISCEGGGGLNAALLAADLVDELWLTVCPVIMGQRGSPALADGEVSLKQRFPGLRLLSAEPVENEVFLHYSLD